MAKNHHVVPEISPVLHPPAISLVDRTATSLACHPVEITPTGTAVPIADNDRFSRVTVVVPIDLEILPALHQPAISLVDHTVISLACRQTEITRMETVVVQVDFDQMECHSVTSLVRHLLEMVQDLSAMPRLVMTQIITDLQTMAIVPVVNAVRSTLYIARQFSSNWWCRRYSIYRNT